MKDKKLYWICLASALLITASAVGIHQCFMKDDSVVMEVENVAATPETSLPCPSTETTEPDLPEPLSTEPKATENEKPAIAPEETAEPSDPEVPFETADAGTTSQPPEETESTAPAETSEPDAAGETESTYHAFPIYYNDGATNITITKEWFCNTWCYAAHVQLSDYSRMTTRCANGAYDNGFQTTSGAANAANAILAVNGDYSAPYLDYIVVRNGKICNGASRSMWLPGVYSAHTGLLLSAWEKGGTPGIAGANVQELVDAGTVTDTFCFGPPILQGGSVLVGGDSRAQRTFIGTNGSAGDIWIVVSDGRYNDGVSVGLTAGECAAFLASKGCSFGVPLDGGGSSTMVFNGQVLNAARGNQRSVVDFLMIL